MELNEVGECSTKLMDYGENSNDNKYSLENTKHCQGNESDIKTKNKSNEKELEGLDKLHDDLKPKIPFHCYLCGMSEKCHYRGIEPQFVSGKIKLCEESYILRNPFTTPPPLGKSKPEYFIVIGTNCSVCKKLVCKDICCSFYYSVTYCINCLKDVMTKLPKEVQVRAKKQIANLK